MDAEHIERMQQLLSRMMMMEGAEGSAGGVPSGGPRGRARQQMQTILKNISNEGDDSDQYQGLSELCNNLNMATEEILASIRPELFVPAIVGCLRKDYNGELMLLAARCLTYMIDALPVSVMAISTGDGVPILLSKLREITDVELAEQCLTCIDKIASEAPSVILNADGISALLGFVDFFNISVQRRAWSCVAGLCKRLKLSVFGLVRGSLPVIRQSFRHEDSKIVEQALLAMSRIVGTASQDPVLVMEAFGDSAEALVEIVEKRALDSIFSNALQLLSAASAASAQVAEYLIEIGTVPSLVSLLQGGLSGPQVATPGGGSAGGVMVQRSPQMGFAPSPLGPGDHGGASSPILQAAGGSGQFSGSTPPAATPPRGSSFPQESSLSSSRQKPLGPEHIKDVVSILVGLLPRVNEGFMVYSHVLAGMNLSADLNFAAVSSAAPAREHPDEEEVRGDDDDNDDEYMDDEGDEPSREDVAALIAEGVVRIQNNPKYSTCRLTHTCDGCRKPKLGAQDWFRCNQCPDFDMCLRCFVMTPGEHDDSHDFTDMSAVLPGQDAEQAKDDQLALVAKKILQDSNSALATPCPRVEMIRRSPYLLQRIADALPTLVRLRRDSEHPKVRALCLVFITRCVHYAQAEDLRLVLADAPLCEVISASIADAELLTQLQCVHICKNLLNKLPDIYTSLFAREGVSNALALLKSTGGGDADIAKGFETAPTHVLCASEAGWRYIVSTEASELLKRFTTVQDTKKLQQLAEISSLMSSKTGTTGMTEAFRRLNELLLDLSTFELMSSTVVRDLVAALRESPDPVSLVIELVSILSDPTTISMSSETTQSASSPSMSASSFGFTDALGSSSGGTTSNLSKLVRHLQSIISQAEKFKPPTFGDVSSIHSQIRLSIAPHKQGVSLLSDSGPQDKQDRLGKQKPVKKVAPAGGKGGAPPTATASSAPLAKAQRGDRKGSKKPESSSTCDPPVVTSGSPTDATATTPSTEGKSAMVSIEPLASIGGVVDFIITNLLPGSSGGRPSGSSQAAGAEEDEVEDILPNRDDLQDVDAIASAQLVASPTATDEGSRKKARKESGSSRGGKQQPAIYIRLGNRALPTNLSMLQVLQRYGPKSTAASTNRMGHDNELKRRLQQQGIPPELQALMEGASSEPVALYYSTQPWGPDVLPEESHAPQPLGNPEDALSLVNDESCFTDGATRVASAVHAKFDFSAKHLVQQLRDPLTLLAVLHAAATNWPSLLQWLMLSSRDASSVSPPSISHMEFINQKLNNKAMRHCSSLLLAGQHLSTWAVVLALDCGFIFAPQTRKFLFEVCFFGTARSLTRMQEFLSEEGLSESSSSSNSQRRQNRLHRKKLRVWREAPLPCAIAALARYHASSDVLEFEFYGEPGSGLGPTLEFFSLSGECIRERKLRLWRRDDEPETERLFTAANGLYPRPLPPSSPEADRIAPYFRFLGQIMARGFLDKRQLNLRLSVPLLKLLRGDVMTIDDLAFLNENLFRILKAIVAAVKKGVNLLEQLPKPCAVEDLGLTFVAPGEDDVELIKNGAETYVTFENADQYVRCVVSFMLKNGVERFARELRQGFHNSVPLYSLRMLQLDELASYLNGHEDPISLQDLEAHVHVDHGFTSSSPQIRHLFDSIASMDLPRQRRFFQFLTGSPYLPVGGLASLRPKFTVVRKTSTDSKVVEQDQLPSAMTCQNYLKLPAYDTKELLQAKLELAIAEGCGAFLFT